MKNTLKRLSAALTCSAVALMSTPAVPFAHAADYVQTGTTDGYDWECWNLDDIGEAKMTPHEVGGFDCQWDDVRYAVFNSGKRFANPQKWSSLDPITWEYDVDFKSDGNAILAVYGWFTEPAVEYYICESYGNLNTLDGYSVMGEKVIDGGTYEVFMGEKSGASPFGAADTYQNIWSVRMDGQKRTKGAVSVSKHFEAWEELCNIELGNLFQVALAIEANDSSGSAQVKKNGFDTQIGSTQPTTPDTTETSGNTIDGYYWFTLNQYDIGETDLNIGQNGEFECSWNDTQFTIFSVGKKWYHRFDWKEFGNIKYEYEFELDAVGSSNGEISGFFVEPDLEFHVVEKCIGWNPPGDNYKLMGTKVIDGAEYKIYLSTAQMSFMPTDMPTILYSVRSEDSLSSKGVVNLDEHFKAWEELCKINLKKLDSAYINIESFNSSGSAKVLKNKLTCEDVPMWCMPEVDPRGDLNNDGKVDAFDLVFEKQAVLASTMGARSADLAADIDSDGNIGINDLVLLSKYLLGEIKSFPASV